MRGRFGLLALAALALASCDGSSREIRVAGSSTVYPFTKAVAEAFVQADSNRKPPAIESIGTGAGFMRFCEGSGFEHPDIADASRRMRRAEYDKCKANGVGDIIEIPIGLDGIALAESSAGPKLELTRKDIYLALAANPLGKPNTAKTWKDVNPALAAIPIRVMGPPSTSGTRDAFLELILEPGCLAAMPTAQDLKIAADPAPFDAACRRIRGDGAYVEKGEDDNLIVQGLAQDQNALGLLGFSYLEKNMGRLRGVPIDGVAPVYDTIASGKYPGVRTLYLYAKKQHLDKVPGLQAFLNLYATMWVPEGPLTKRGLIAATPKVRRRALETIQIGRALDTTGLP